MSVLVDEQFGAGVRPAGLRRPSHATRRPPRGTRVTSERSRVAPSACELPRERRRWQLLLATAAAVCAFVVVFGAMLGGLANGVASDVPDRTAVVSVAPGESLWDVAAKFAPESDPRAVVQRIEELNGVSADAVTPGVPLTVPVGSAG